MEQAESTNIGADLESTNRLVAQLMAVDANLSTVEHLLGLGPPAVLSNPRDADEMLRTLYLRSVNIKAAVTSRKAIERTLESSATELAKVLEQSQGLVAQQQASVEHQAQKLGEIVSLAQQAASPARASTKASSKEKPSRDELTPEERAVFEAIDAMTVDDPNARARATRLLAGLTGNRVTRPLVEALKASLRKKKWGVRCTKSGCGRSATVVWQATAGAEAGGYMEFSHAGTDGGWQKHLSFSELPPLSFVARKSRPRSA